MNKSGSDIVIAPRGRRLVFLGPPPLVRWFLNPRMWGWLIMGMMIGALWGIYELAP